MPGPNLYVWRVCLFASLGSVLAGYYDGSMNGILEMKSFQATFYDSEQLSVSQASANNFSWPSTAATNLSKTCSSGNGAGSDVMIGLIVSISNLGSVGGSLLAGWMSDRFSRKYGLLMSGVVVAIGSALLAASFHLWTFVIGRGICGIGIGIIYMVMPVYISETSPKQSRGMLTSLIGPGYATGIIISLCTNIPFSRIQLGWRVATIVQLCSALLFSAGMKWMTHSPRWLVMKQRDKEALLILTKINHHSQLDKSLETHFELEELKACSRETIQCNALLKEILKWKYLSRLLLVAILFFTVAATGSFLLFFTVTLFCGVNVDPFITALAVGLIIMTASVTLPLFIDKVGRRISLLCGSSLDTILAAIAASLILYFGSSSQAVTIAVVVIVCIYAFSFSSTWLTIPFIINSEIFPVHIRGLTVAVATSSYWFFTFFINQVTPLVFGSPIKIHGFFYIVAGINFFSIFFVLFFLPETKGVSLEQMDELFSQGCRKSISRASYSVGDKMQESNKKDIKSFNCNEKT